MQAQIADQINTFNRLSTELTEKATTVGKTFWGASFAAPWEMGPWAQVGKSWCSAVKSLTDSQADIYTQTLNNPLRVQQLTLLAESSREVSQILRDFMLALTQRQLETCHSFTNAYADFLQASKQSASATEILATQMQWPTHIQNTFKEHAIGTSELFSSLQTAMMAWSENALNAMTEETATPPTPKKQPVKAESTTRVSSVG